MPDAAEPDVDLSTNTTWHLIADLEQLRNHLGIEKWLLLGAPHGATPRLAYGEQHPERGPPWSSRKGMEPVDAARPS